MKENKEIYVNELFILINEVIEKFNTNHPEFKYTEIALNAVVTLTGALVNSIARGKTLSEKLKLLDDLVKLEKEWITYEHANSH
jgi:hypothetical protein